MSGKDYYTFVSRADGLREATLSAGQKFRLADDVDVTACANCGGEVFKLVGKPKRVCCASCNLIIALDLE